MAGTLADEIIYAMEQAAGLYHRLVMVVAAPGGGKTEALQAVAQRTGYRYINVSLQLGQRLLDVNERQRPLQVGGLLREIVGESDNQPVLLDNIELLFDASLKQEPLTLLQRLARNRTLVVAWSGTADGSYLTYAAPDHPEYRRYPATDLVIVRS